MANSDGPWSHPPRKSSSPSPILLWAVVAGAVGLGIWELSRLFPDSLTNDFSRANLIQLVGFLALVSAGVATSRRLQRKDALRNIAIWCGVFVVLMTGYIFRESFADVWGKFRQELLPNYPVASGAHELTLTADASDSFYAVGSINGAPAKFLIDTGASSIVLSPEDAERAGINVAALDYKNMFETAHGSGRGAYTIVDQLTVGPIVFRDVPVFVNESSMGSSLLGLTFLRRLDSFEMKGQKLTLHWRG